MSKENFSRRRFIGTTAVGLAGITILPSLSSCATKAVAEEGIRLGIIGLGRQAMFLLNGFLQIAGVKVVAGCDVYGRKRTRFENKVNEFYASKQQNVEVKSYERFTDLLAREDIDAVVIAVPDHWHALIAIAACNAGKDVYLEKPMTFTIKEGQELIKAVRGNNRILGIGSQQRSDPNFQHAVKLVQSGAIGKIEKVNAYVGAPPTPYNLPEETVPEDLNWDLWLGPLRGDIHFNKELNPPISLNPPKDEEFWGGWRWYKEMGGGFTTDWGAHMFDIAQWGLGMDNNGPVKIAPIGDGSEFIHYEYANGVVMTSETFDEAKTKGVKFWGDNGWIEVSRGHYKASDDSLLPADSGQADDDTPYETKIPHQVNFIEAVKKRIDPVVPVEIGHSSCTVCTLGNIACDLGREIIWDPKAQSFGNDEAAVAYMQYQYREPWKL
ncbi:Gfo/Idh/MocA family oxidoreductase [Maribellus sp. CM-23]|uniref:Gfo/Idh/MocA family protein n=1 Tax=Maribellus sp. CM-23 TaxID=2781026 RepID=UPI001F20304D|nr:Gfo/Idh/MocA family oxidoreductase [Maribellus sp. CM-23]MCE4563260.1 Gfo/Idh/MocA family oxidoreductase [Maribellus sp. CM-23]